MRISCFALVAIASATCSSSIAFGATVMPMSGRVEVSTGQGFHQVDAATEFPAGAQVIVRPGSSAKIAYSETCVVPVRAASVAIVQDKPPCGPFAPPSHFGFESSKQYSSAADETEFATKVSNPERRTVFTKDDPSCEHDYLLIGGLLIGGGGLAALLLSQGSGNPGSP